MPALAIATVIASLVAAGAAVYNANAQQTTNASNQSINDKNLEYNAYVQQQTWEREDNAHQREVADLEAAGLSPLANTTGSQVSSPIGAPSPIAMQAPQFDSTALVNSLIQSAQLAETNRHNKALEGYKDTELSNQSEQIKIASEQLKLNNKKVMADIQHNADLIDLENKQIEETIRSHKAEEQLKKSAHISEVHFKEIKSQVGADDLPYRAYYGDNYDIYVNADKLWNLEYKHWLESHNEPIVGSEGENSSKSQNGGFGLGVGTANVNANAGVSNSNGSYKSWNNSDYFREELKKFYFEHPKPVYFYYKYGD